MPTEPIIGVVLANELLDNLAPRVVRRSGDGWNECHVDDGARRWVPCEAPPDPVPSGAPFDGNDVPWCAQAREWTEQALALVERGRILVVDYGVQRSAELAGRGWLRTYRDHLRGADPLAEPGAYDITFDVPFDQLAPGAAISSQRDFLRQWGIDALVDEGKAVWAERAHLGDLAAVRARSRVSEAEALLDPSGLGSFLVAEWTIGS